MTTTTNMNDFVQQNPNFDLDNFKRFERKTKRSRAGYPFIGISKKQMTMNSRLISEMKFVEHEYRFVEFFTDYQNGQLMFMLSKEKNSSDAYAISQKSISTQRNISMSVKFFIENLSKAFSFMNTQNFRYRFRPVLLDEKNGRVVINLKDPSDKVSTNKNY